MAIGFIAGYHYAEKGMATVANKIGCDLFSDGTQVMSDEWDPV